MVKCYLNHELKEIHVSVYLNGALVEGWVLKAGQKSGWEL